MELHGATITDIFRTRVLGGWWWRRRRRRQRTGRQALPQASEWAKLLKAHQCMPHNVIRLSEYQTIRVNNVITVAPFNFKTLEIEEGLIWDQICQNIGIYTMSMIIMTGLVVPQWRSNTQLFPERLFRTYTPTSQLCDDTQIFEKRFGIYTHACGRYIGTYRVPIGRVPIGTNTGGDALASF
jgi:hypothetical protein